MPGRVLSITAVAASPGSGPGADRLIRFYQLGESEVEDLRIAVLGDHYVFGLQVAMDDAGGVGLGEPVGGLREVLEQLFQFEELTMNLEMQGRAADVLHRDVMRDILGICGVELSLTDLVDGYDVRMVQRRSGFCFTDESAHAIRIGHQSGGKNLQRDGAIQPGVGGFVDLAHAARADWLEYFVVSECRSGCEGHIISLRVPRDYTRRNSKFAFEIVNGKLHYMIGFVGGLYAGLEAADLGIAVEHKESPLVQGLPAATPGDS